MYNDDTPNVTQVGGSGMFRFLRTGTLILRIFYWNSIRAYNFGDAV